MIYLLINNNFHYYDLSLHLEALSWAEVSLIAVPHKLDADYVDGSFKKKYNFDTPFKGVKGYLDRRTIHDSQESICSQIKPGPEDVLIFYTEFELLNQFIVSLFKKSGAKVFLLEEGLPTYINFCTESTTALSLKYKLKLAYIHNVLRYEYVDYLSLNGFGYPRIRDSFIDGVLFYFNTHVNRDVPNYRISKEVETMSSTDPTKVIFLNEGLYLYYMGWDVYIDELKRVISALSHQFETVYFKYHPKENAKSKVRIRQALEGFSNVQFIEATTPIETLIVELQAKHAVSFFSAALMNLHVMGIDPIYIYPFIPSLQKLDIIKTIHGFLESINYIFPNSLDELKLETTSRIPETADSPSLGAFLQSRLREA